MPATPRIDTLAERKHLLTRQADLQRQLIGFEWRRLHQCAERARPGAWLVLGGAVGLTVFLASRRGGGFRWVRPLLAAALIGRRVLKG